MLIPELKLPSLISNPHFPEEEWPHGHSHQQPLPGAAFPNRERGRGLLQVSLTPLALVKATPEKAYLSTTTVIP